MKENKYLESFKIDLVKQYLSGKTQKSICDEYNIAKSTMRGRVSKYAPLIQDDWVINDIKSCNDEWVDITSPIKREFKELSFIKTNNETIRIFKNGYSIICHVSKLAEVMRLINYDRS